MPATHDFSVLIDWSANTATTGANGLVKQVALAQNSDGHWTAQEPLVFQSGLYPYPDLTYSGLAFNPVQDGCTATASGTYYQTSGDVIYSRRFTATMTGAVDRAGPQFAIAPTGELHPLSFVGVMVNEVLPTGTTASLGAPGTLLALTGLPADGTLGVSGFSLPGTSLAQPSKALAFATAYNLRVLPQPEDLAGNLATALPAFSTLADPGLFAQDGFEGPVNAYLAGSLAITDSASLPIPAGDKALAIPPSDYSSPCPARFTVRMAVSPGATTVKFSTLSYRSLTGYPATIPYSYLITVAVPNGDLLSTYDIDLKTSPLPKPWTGDLPGSANNAYGDLKEAELTIPSGASGEILFDVYRICAQPGGPEPGLIIDDLRVSGGGATGDGGDGGVLDGATDAILVDRDSLAEDAPFVAANFCPAKAPTVGSPCPAPPSMSQALLCEYGDQIDVGSHTRFYCDGAWHSAGGPPYSASVACPATVPANGVVDCGLAQQVCSYPSGTTCICRACPSGGIDAGACQQPQRYWCAAAPGNGCPLSLPRLGTPCSPAALRCLYSACSQLGVQCRDGIWQQDMSGLCA